MNCQLRNIFPKYFASEELHKCAKKKSHNWLCFASYIWNVLKILNAVKGSEYYTKREI